MLDNILNRGVVVQDNDCRISQRGTSGRGFRYVMVFYTVLVVMICMGVSTAWGQTTGLYYIANNNDKNPEYSSSTASTNYYLVPASDGGEANIDFDRWAWNNDTVTPFVTTFKTNKDNNSIWVIKESETSGEYYLIHLLSGKYMTRNNGVGKDSNRRAFHMEDPSPLGDDHLFNFTSHNGTPTYYSIKPKSLSLGHRFLNPSKANQDKYYGYSSVESGVYIGGLIGTFNKNATEDKGSKWFLESASLLDAPAISNVSASNTITITDANSLPSGYTIRYTTGDGSQDAPTASTGDEYSGAITVTDNWTVKAIVVRYGIVLTNVATKAVEPAVVAPTITNNGDGTISLSTPTPNATMYYTIDGEVPSSSSQVYNEAFPLGNATVIKAITFFGSVVSDVTTYNVPQWTPPTISFDNVTSTVTITSDGLAYYTTDGGTPTTSSTPYSERFSVTFPTTVKAIATHAGYLTSDVATLAIAQVATPTIQNNGSNAISITSATNGASIYYTTDGSTPTVSSAEYTGPLTEGVSGVNIKAIAVKENMINSVVGSGTVMLKCEAPVIVRNDDTGFRVTSSFPASGVTIHYTTGDGSQASPSTLSSSVASGGMVLFDLPTTVKAMAVATGYENSDVTTTALILSMGGDGSSADPYTIEYQSDVADFINKANTAAEASKHYKIISRAPLDFSSVSAITQPFSGTFDGGMQTIIGLTHALFNTVSGGTVKNVMLKDVSISSGTNVGAIANEVIGTSSNIASIYNCGILPSENGSSISGSGSVGSLVGLLGSTSDNDKCYARVINCYSYANITGGSVKAGIVGNNCFASKYDNIRTMVMNCMFYGDITTGGTISPIYGGEEISNDYKANTNNRLNNYNYYLYEAPFSKNNTTNNVIISKYNCALAAEERFLVRFEFYRHILNSTRELAAWYATGDAANGRGIGDANKMAKWVLDKSIAPYPILKVQGTYPSVVNYDPEYTNDVTGAKVRRSSVTERNKGKDLGTTLTITIRNSTSGGQAAPTGASIETTSLLLPRIDKDYNNYNFNYDKVQLPYYNEVGTKNYTENKVVTGWKIVSMTGGTSGGYTETNYDAPNYNYADRDHIGKDLYSVSKRVYPQGGYFNVPTGVTDITIEPYWGKAAYLSDACYDRYGYNTTDDLTQVGGGQRYTNDTNCPVLEGEQKVYTDVTTALAALTGVSNATVYDYALVLVGNYHHHATEGKGGPELSNGTTPFTIMSIDLNKDNEPDYCMIYRSGKNQQICPIRFDFITVPGMVMAHKNATNSDLGIPGNCCPKGWFEITTTGLIKYGQFEHSYNGKTLAPLILMGGVIDQFVVNNTGTTTAYNDKTRYMLFGDNVWFKMLSNGNHMDKSQAMPHRPISITGGEFESLYLSGYFRPDANAWSSGTNGDKNAECYIDGGKFGEVAGAGQENIDGNITWLIDHADMESFYGGGLKVVNNGSQITGNISTTIKNSHVGVFCGGPKFGDMASEKTVTTTATDCVFGTYFGAGYGGTSIYRECPKDYNKFEVKNYDFNSWVNGSYDNSGKDPYRGKYTSGKGVACGYEYELFGGSAGNVGRLYLKYASFSLAQTNNVTSTLTGCTVTGNFYGGGSLGKVTGDVTSTLLNCEVNGSVFGAGYSASIPTASIMKTGGFTVNGVSTNPNYNETTGVYEKADLPATDDFTWTHVESLSNGDQAIDETTVKTTEDLTGLGSVAGKVTLNIEGTTTVTGSVYGGGESSDVYGENDSHVITSEVEVNIKGGTMTDVFGGGYGETTVVAGDVTVNIGIEEEGNYVGTGTVSGSVYGGSALGAVNAKKGTNDVPEYSGSVSKPAKTYVNVYKGTVEGSVFGGGLGQRNGVLGATDDVAAEVYGDATVTIGATAEAAAPTIRGSVLGGSNVNGISEKDVYVNIIRGNITGATVGGVFTDGNVHGGGLGQYTLVKGNVEVNIGCRTGTEGSYKSQGYAVIEGNVYGGSALGNVNARKAADFTYELPTYEYSGSTDEIKTGVTLYGGTVKGSVFGGGLGQRLDSDNSLPEIASDVYGPVTVLVNPYLPATAEDKNCVVQGNVFGSNDQFGTPKQTVTVHVFRTQGWTGHDVSEGKADDTKPKTGEKYELAAVYGGGNLADYVPLVSDDSTIVIIEGCDYTSIAKVYGGGNAASTPATYVLVYAAYEIGEVFGGGNGKDRITVNGVQKDNPGADVGYRYNETETYGTGRAVVNILGGTIYEVYGGSDTKGNVRSAAIMRLEENNPENCPYNVGHVYGGGKNAPMDGKVVMDIGCVPNMERVFGGAEDADVNNDIVMNLTNGTFKQVFGGNNVGGRVKGTITINIEETGCKPIIIGELYGGGNQAAYSVFGYVAKLDENSQIMTDELGKPIWLPLESMGEDNIRYRDPEVNVKSFTSIGTIYGGGYGVNAVMVGDPHVNINVGYGAYYDTEYSYFDGTAGDDYPGTTMTIDGNDIVVPAHTKGTIGVIREVFGGGNSAKLVGDTYVNIGTETKVEMETLARVQATDDNGDPLFEDDDVTPIMRKQTMNVVGANIIGNVYGGGNSAAVTGCAHVKIGPDPE